MRDDDDFQEMQEEDEKLKSVVIDKVVILFLTLEIEPIQLQCKKNKYFLYSYSCDSLVEFQY